MGSPAAFADLVYLELRDRYERLCRRSGAVGTEPPDPALARAVADATAQATRRDTVRERVHYAGETYEYLLRRWQDPRWRALVAVAREMEARGATSSIGGPLVGASWRRRSAGSYTRDGALAGLSDFATL
ncbi:MAG TPA: hypothetical protein VGA37_14865 [Gemmatimonadales bacterium]